MNNDKALEAKMNEALMDAWGIIANAFGGDWSKASPEWRQAAERWRDKYITHRAPAPKK